MQTALTNVIKYEHLSGKLKIRRDYLYRRVVRQDYKINVKAVGFKTIALMAQTRAIRHTLEIIMA